MGMCCRMDLAGVTSFVRVLRLKPRAYPRFLGLFHSKGLDLDLLTHGWIRLALALFTPFEAGGRIVLIADGIKAAKEGRKMPGVKSLHQESGSNSKAEYIMGPSLQAVSLLVRGVAGHVAAIPLVSRIHEGLVFTNRDHRTLMDKLVALLHTIVGSCERRILLVADAAYANRSIIRPLLAKGHHLVSRVRNNSVAYFSPEQPSQRGKGRPRIYGDRALLNYLAKDQDAFLSAPSPVYGENDVMIRYRSGHHPRIPVRARAFPDFRNAAQHPVGGRKGGDARAKPRRCSRPSLGQVPLRSSRNMICEYHSSPLHEPRG
jgi:hypothetical protein